MICSDFASEPLTFEIPQKKHKTNAQPAGDMTILAIASALSQLFPVLFYEHKNRKKQSDFLTEIEDINCVLLLLYVFSHKAMKR